MTGYNNKQRFHSFYLIGSLVLLFGLIHCGENKSISSVGSLGSGSDIGLGSGSGTPIPDKALDPFSGDETHFFALTDVKSIDISDATALFTADRAEISKQPDVETSSQEGSALFKVDEDGNTSEVAFLNAEDETLDNADSPTKTIQGDGYVIMGFGSVKYDGNDYDKFDESSDVSTVIVRQSDGATYLIGDTIDVFPANNPNSAIYGKFFADDTYDIRATSSGSVYYRTVTNRIVRISNIDDISGSDTIQKQFLTVEGRGTDYFMVNNDDLVLFDGKIARVGQDGNLSLESAFSTQNLFATHNEIYSIKRGLWDRDPETGALVESTEITGNEFDYTIQTLNWNTDKSGVESTFYAHIKNGPAYLDRSFAGRMYRTNDRVFLLENTSGGILELENPEGMPRVIKDGSIRKVLRGKTALYIIGSGESIQRLSADGMLEDLQGIDRYEIDMDNITQQSDGTIILTGLDPSTATNITGEIREDQNDIQLIEVVPFDPQITDLIQLD